MLLLTVFEENLFIKLIEVRVKLFGKPFDIICYI